MLQEIFFSNGESDRYFNRNINSIMQNERRQDYIYKFLAANHHLIFNKNVLEIGCCNGYRLSWLRDDFQCMCYGCDPSEVAINDGIVRYCLSNLFVMKQLESFWQRRELSKKFCENFFDVVIFGFCLYLVTPSILPFIVAEIDNILKVGGYVIIFDFHSPPYKRPYHHINDKEVFSYKMDYAKIFTWLPYYHLIEKKVISQEYSVWWQDDRACSVIKKVDINTAYPTYPI